MCTYVLVYFLLLTDGVKQITPPAIVVYNLNVNMVEERYQFPDDVVRDSSVLTSIVSFVFFFATH